VATRKSSSEVNSALQRFRFAATGRWAVSIRTYVAIVFPFGFLTSIEREQLLNPGPLSQSALIALGGELACALFVFVTQALLLGNRTRELVALWRCVFLWFGAGVVRGTFTALNAFWGFDRDYDFGVRIPAALFFTGSAMALSAFYFGTIERKRIQSRALFTLGTFLEQDEAQLAQIAVERRLKAIEVIEVELLPKVSQLKNGIKSVLLTTPPDESQEIDKDELEILYNQSRDLASALDDQKQSYDNLPERLNSSVSRENSSSYISAILPKVISIRVTFLVIIIGSFSGQFARNGLEGLIAGFLGAIIITSYLLPISQLIKRNLGPYKVLIFLAYLGAFVVQAGYNVIQPKIGIILDFPFPPWYSGIKTTYGVFIASIIATLIIEVQGKFESEIERGSDLIQKVDDLNTRAELLEMSVFEGRYGTLQGKITGVTMALHLMASMNNITVERKSELLSGANDLLSESLSEIEKLKAHQ
jgi:hypothetical protein